jgi:hypothetical protein
MNSNLYIIQRLSAANINDLAKLHTAVYNRTATLSLFINKYDTAYTNVIYTGFIAYNEALQPIAYYGVIPCFLWCDGKVILAAQSADTMTHPDYRNRGLFVELANLTYELCRAEGIKIIFGFPNQNSLPGFINKLGWQVMETMDCFIIPVKAVPLEKLSVKIPLLKVLYKRYIKLLFEKYYITGKGISITVTHEGFDGVFRDGNYLQHKTYSATQVIKVDGATLWIKINNGLMIGDITGITFDNFDEVMAKLTKLAQQAGLTQIQFHTSQGTNLHALFSSRYKAIPSFPVIFKQLGEEISTEKIKFTFADIDIF